MPGSPSTSTQTEKSKSTNINYLALLINHNYHRTEATRTGTLVVSTAAAGLVFRVRWIEAYMEET